MKHSLKAKLLCGLLVLTPAFSYAQVQDHSGHKSPLGHQPCADCDINALHERSEKPFEFGQDRLAAMQEMVMMLEGKPDTDWSKFNLNAFYVHLVDMDEIAQNTVFETEELTNGLRFILSGGARTMEALARVIPEQAITLGRINAWDSDVQVGSDSLVLTMTSEIPEEVLHIKGLGFMGLMSTGTGHHQPFHLALARGEVQGGWPRAEYMATPANSMDHTAQPDQGMAHTGADGQTMTHTGSMSDAEEPSAHVGAECSDHTQGAECTKENATADHGTFRAAHDNTQMQHSENGNDEMHSQHNMGNAGSHGQTMSHVGSMSDMGQHSSHIGAECSDHEEGTECAKGNSNADHKMSCAAHGNTRIEHGENNRDGMHSQHKMGSPAAGVATLAGQDAFGAIQEIIAILEADASTDWNKVDISVLRSHLVDMNRLVIDAEVAEETVAGGLRIAISGQGKTLDTVQEMVIAHASTINGYNGWSVIAELTSQGATLTVTSGDEGEAAHIRGLGFFGLMASGSHHQMHHLSLARGESMHSQ